MVNENLTTLSTVKRAVLAVEDLRARLEVVERARTEPIAIVGIGCRFPGGANDPESFWQLLRNGVDAITAVPRERWDAEAIYDPDASVRGKTNARWGAFLERVDEFDAAFFGISPREATYMDPQQRLVLEVAWEALEDAGHAVERLAGTPTGVFLGIYNNDYAWLQSNEMDDVDVYAATGAGQGIAANRVSYLLDLHGPSIAVDTTCSSSLVAVHLACQSLRSGECRVALAGGVNLILSPHIALSVSKIVPMAADGRCKTFDARADGIVRGEGCGIVVLKRLADAQTDNDNIVAVIRGSAVNQDGHSNGFTAPNCMAQKKVIQQALKNGGIAASQISYVEAHGTGTPLGDPIELEALDEVIGSQRNGNSCVVGSVKTNLGHLEAAAGIAGLIKVALSVKHREIAPHLHFREMNPLASTSDSLQVPTRLREWKDKTGALSAGISSFSLGGTNAHVVVSEAPAVEATVAEHKDQVFLLPLSARSQAGLEAYARAFRKQLLDSSYNDSPGLYDVAYAASLRRSHLPYRLALIGRTRFELANLIDGFIEGQTPRGLASGRAGGARQGIVFVFSGQGAQWRGMGKQLMDQEPTFRATLEQCHELFAQFGVLNLMDDLNCSDQAQPDNPQFVQAATFAMQVGLSALLREWGVEPDAVIGHSIGEIAAAYTAGILTLEDGVRVVSARAKLFERILGRGGMAAVELSALDAERVLRDFPGPVSLAAHNSPTTTVLSGESLALQELVDSLQQRKVQCRHLQANCAFHSPQVEPLLPELEEALQGLTPQRGSFRFESTVLGESIDGNQLGAAYWVHNARETVRFAKAIENLGQDYDIFLEVSAHPVLAHNITQCLEGRERKAHVVPTLRRDADERTMLLRSLGALYAVGHPIKWERLYTERGHHVRLPSYPWQRSRYWIQAEDHPKRELLTPLSLQSKVHPLLGRRLQTPVHTFESQLSASSLKYLNRHLIDGHVVLPAACYLEMALAAAPEYQSVRDLIFHEPLVLSSEAARRVQLVLTPEVSGAATIQIFSFEASKDPDHSFWRLHATGQLYKTHDRIAREKSITLEALRNGFQEEIGIEEFDLTRRKYGFQSGAGVQGIEKLWRTGGETLGQIRLSTELDEMSAYEFHPALLDACFQLLMAILAGDEEVNAEEVYLATSVDRFACLRRPPSEIWSHIVFRPADKTNQATRTVDVHIYDSSGNAVAEVEALSLRRLPRRALQIATQPSSDDYYEVQWQPKRLASQWSISTVEIARRVRSEVVQAVERFGLNQFIKIEPEVESLCAKYIVDALRELGITLEVGQRITAQSLIEQLQILPRYQRLLERLFEILSEDEILSRKGDDWEVRQSPQGSAELKWRSLIDAFPAFNAELSLLGRCGSSLAKVLCGKVDPLELLFPGGSLTEAEHLYQASPIAQTFNTLLERALRLALERLGDGETVRVLEIGAGTGGSTSYVLPLLPPEQTSYVFTDVSNLFLFKARQKFADFPFIDYKLLDIDRDPLDQGFGRQQFDIVLASNVLHGTSDLRKSVKHAQRLMAADGLLVLLESTGPQRLVDLTFGLTEDWWQFADSELRPKHPLLPTNKWLDLLSDVGFTNVTAIPEPSDVKADYLQTALILAQAPALSSDDANGSWVVFTDGGDVGEKLVASLRSRGGTVTEVYPTTLTPDFTQLLSAISGSPKCRGLIYLWSLKASITEESIPAESLGSAALDHCSNVLSLVQALAQSAHASPRLWIVTRGAQSVVTAEAGYTLSSATLWGLGATLSMEHPEMWGGLIDLDASGPKDDAERLLVEILGGSGEDQVACRGDQRYVPRLRLRPRKQTFGLVRFRSDSSYLITGGFGGMGLMVAQWMVERGARNLVLAGRSGAASEEARAGLRKLEQAGAKITAARVDVSDEQTVARLLSELRKTGPPLRGVFHAAGIFDDRVLLRHDRERFARVMAPKVNGAWNLHRLTSDLPLDFFVLFSSAAAFLGLMGLGNYTAANAFLDALAHYRRSRGLPALSIDWAGWTRVGMAEVLGERREGQWLAKGLDSLLPHQGLQVLNDLMLQDVSQVAHLKVDWSTFFKQLPVRHIPPLLLDIARATQRNQSSQHSSAPDEFLRKLNEATPGAARSALLRDHICRQVTTILELEPSMRFDHQQPLAELGLDSLMAVELRNLLASSIGQSLPATLFFDYPTIDAVHSYLASDIFKFEPQASTLVEASETDPEFNAILDELDDLSDSAVEKMLQEYAGNLLT